MRLGKVNPAYRARSTSPIKRVLHQFGRANELDMLCQGEVDPFWGEGHLPTLGAEAGE